MQLPARVTICEVGTRDGFQIEPDFIPTEQKIEVVNLLSDAGVPTGLHLHPGCPHAFEVLARGADVSQRAIADRVRRLRNF